MHVNGMSGSGVVCDWWLDCGGRYQMHYADSLHYQLGAAVQLDWSRHRTLHHSVQLCDRL